MVTTWEGIGYDPLIGAQVRYDVDAMQSQAWLTGEGGESSWVDVSWNHAVNIGAPVNPFTAGPADPTDSLEDVGIPPTQPAIGPTPVAEPDPILDTEFTTYVEGLEDPGGTGWTPPWHDPGDSVIGAILDPLLPGDQDTWHDFIPGVEQGTDGGVVVDLIPGAGEGVVPDIAQLVTSLAPLMLVMNMFNDRR